MKHKVDVNQTVARVDPLQGGMMGPNEGAILGDTPLHLAAFCGETKMVALLLKSGADVNAANTTQMTPLDLAGSMRPPSFRIGIMQWRNLGLLAPLESQQNLMTKSQAKMNSRRSATDLLKAAGGKHSLKLPTFAR
jgi:ankyrin repeat protein